jgi:hypothetical protein
VHAVAHARLRVSGRRAASLLVLQKQFECGVAPGVAAKKPKNLNQTKEATRLKARGLAEAWLTFVIVA